MSGTEVHDLDDANIKLLKMFDDLQMVVSLIRQVQKENMHLKQETECQRETIQQLQQQNSKLLGANAWRP